MFRKSMSHGIENGRFLQKWEEKALVGRPVLPCFPLYVSVKSSLTPPKVFMIYYIYLKIFIPTKSALPTSTGPLKQL